MLRIGIVTSLLECQRMDPDTFIFCLFGYTLRTDWVKFALKTKRETGAHDEKDASAILPDHITLSSCGNCRPVG